MLVMLEFIIKLDIHFPSFFSQLLKCQYNAQSETFMFFQYNASSPEPFYLGEWVRVPKPLTVLHVKMASCYSRGSYYHLTHSYNTWQSESSLPLSSYLVGSLYKVSWRICHHSSVQHLTFI